MVQFGRRLSELVLTGWEGSYVPYNDLKKQIKIVAADKEHGRLVDAVNHTNEFFKDLQNCIVQAHRFFKKQVEAEWGPAVDSVSEQVFKTWRKLSVNATLDDDDRAVLSALVEKMGHVHSIEQFATINREAVRKIVKKFDKKTDNSRSTEVKHVMEAYGAFVDDRLPQIVNSYQGLYELVKKLGGEAAEFLDLKLKEKHEQLPEPYEETEAKDEKKKAKDESWMRHVNARNVFAVVLVAVGVYAMILGLGVRPGLVETCVYIGVPSAFVMAMANGANDIANSMGTSVGADALTVRQALVIAVVFEVAGALSMGGEVAKAISKGVLKADSYDDDPQLFAWGMVCVLMGSMATTLLATIWGYPISATHSIIASLVAVGLASVGGNSINAAGITKTCIGWVASPVAGVVVSMVLHSATIKLVLQSERKEHRARQARPGYITLAVAIAALLILIKGPPSARVKPVGLAVLIALCIGAGCAMLDHAARRYLALRKSSKIRPDDATAPGVEGGKSAAGEEGAADSILSLNPFMLLELLPGDKGAAADETAAAGGEDEGDDQQRAPSSPLFESAGTDANAAPADGARPRHRDGGDTMSVGSDMDINEVRGMQKAEEQFIPLLVLSAVSVAFAHGANDLGNAVGPLSAILEVHEDGEVQTKPSIEWWTVCLGAAGFATGILILGNRTIETVGNKLSALTPSKAFGTQISAAIVVLVSSALGLPVSTSHILIGCVVGVGLAEKACKMGGYINWRMLLKIVAAWGITIPLAMAAAIIVFYTAQHRYR